MGICHSVDTHMVIASSTLQEFALRMLFFQFWPVLLMFWVMLISKRGF